MTRRPLCSTLFPYTTLFRSVVDDAIVVLENIERWVSKGEKARAATLKAMAEITGHRLEGGGQRLLPLRSEEHTSELQSLRHLVCRLLLEKKKKTMRRTKTSI